MGTTSERSGMSPAGLHRLYSELAHWWPLMSPPEEYVEEAADLVPEMLAATHPPPRTLLELGSGGGSLAFHLKRHFELSLTDLSPEMLAVSRAVNPECEHLQGDMRSLDLGRTFDLVLIHDAIMYMTEPAEVQAALATAARHCRPGGAVFLLPDCVEESFEAGTSEGGHDGSDGRGLRYLEWSWDRNPQDHTFDVAYAFLLRAPDGRVAVESDLHREGLFPRAAWLEWIEAAGFSASSRLDPWDREVFRGRRLDGLRP